MARPTTRSSRLLDLGLLLLLALPAALPDSALAQSLAVRFYPAKTLYTYPLESTRNLQGLLLQNIVVANTGSVPLALSDVELRVMGADGATDIRRLGTADLQRSATSGVGLQAAGMIDALDFQFGGAALFGTGRRLAGGTTLAAGESLLIGHQFMSFRGTRQAVEVQATARTGDGATVTGQGTLPILEGSRNRWRFPLAGRWTVVAGPTPFSHHRWVSAQEFALDIARFGDGNSSFRGDGTRLTDYHAYGAEVLAAAPGVVRAVQDTMAETDDDLRRPGEAQLAYLRRVGESQMKLMARGVDAIPGNFVLIEHAGGESSMYAHLQPGSVRVKVGDAVVAGQRIGRLGSSGNSTEPHLHFQVCDKPAVLHCAGVPVVFDDIELPYADAPRPVQSGDVVVTTR